MAFGLAAYVSRMGCPSPRKARFQVLVKLSWTGFHPQGSDKRFSTHFMCVVLLFQASWHNPLFFSLSWTADDVNPSSARNWKLAASLPERAYAVKGGLCGFCRLGEALFLLSLQTICAVRYDGSWRIAW